MSSQPKSLPFPVEEIKGKCEFCGSKEHLVPIPTQSSEHILCLECAAKVSVEALRYHPMGAVQ